jgi:hypothetical protein
LRHLNKGGKPLWKKKHGETQNEIKGSRYNGLKYPTREAEKEFKQDEMSGTHSTHGRK